MAKKSNSNARAIDLTSYTFVQTCGGCHPGGGPAEYDRNGKRYDLFAADPKNNIISGGNNNFDGDYYKAGWAESGVLEADCLMCHMPEYGYGLRKKQVKALNFRWAATAGAGFATVTGSVARHEKPQLKYNLSAFRSDGKVALPMVREIPTENCLHCHREPDWKKKGASYNVRTDVHIRAGLKCVDCHVTGRKASDGRIAGREMHQIGKGDDPTGLVRNDLDNTMRSCEDCHFRGELRTKIAAHKGLPPIHLQKIACLTCHVPQRQVKAALMQDSTVFNDVPRISVPGKRIWTFYGPEMKPWNLYGEASTFTVERQPLHLFSPVRAWYKGKIYPMNRIDSIWIAIMDDTGTITGQPYMKDLYKMWAGHRKNPGKVWSDLNIIKDDNRDGAPEANRPEEIQALLQTVTAYLIQQNEPLDGKNIALISGDTYTLDGTHWQPLKFRPQSWQYTPYSSVFKLSHDIAPADSALGAGGCTDCHSNSSPFWQRPVMARPFVGDDAHSSWISNAHLLGLSKLGVTMGALRHQVLEPVLFYGLLAAGGLLVVILLVPGISIVPGACSTLTTDPAMRHLLAILGVAILGPAIILLGGDLLSSEVIGVLGNIHKAVAILMVLAVVLMIIRGQRSRSLLFVLGVVGIVFMATTGIILLFAESMDLRQIVFTLHDIGAVALVALAVFGLLTRLLCSRDK